MPKLTVEIISKSSIEKDEDIKFKLYEKEGILYYIIVYPDFEKVRVFKLVNEIYKKVYEGDRKFNFKFDECEIEIDFLKIFK
ncbi:Uma2 family endonuclease [Hydrogenimonas thermophila]|uniref:Uma2 family endonuclease n=1 Tax=Hydrogenimonas thermophila TaxID=223786 RepID=UPI00293711BC|nr:Uma2 family endonuclease [Hydrogenimonas thermophila]WOE69348.1 Uma2 family endonuclease [Hydrogenimonas thermophila]WOE71858.1 Uma2 family endonuclease [Hydrogenimonas thermophila]